MLPGPNVLSVVSYWEVLLKSMKGNLRVGDPHSWWHDALEQLGGTPLALRPDHVAEIYTLPPIHMDPFDRILIAQAAVEDLDLVTLDAQIPLYASTRRSHPHSILAESAGGPGRRPGVTSCRVPYLRVQALSERAKGRFNLVHPRSVCEVKQRGHLRLMAADSPGRCSLAYALRPHRFVEQHFSTLASLSGLGPFAGVRIAPLPPAIADPKPEVR